MNPIKVASLAALAGLSLVPSAWGQVLSEKEREANRADRRAIVLQSTTSTQNSGLYRHILPRFTDETGIRVNVVAVGTGQALNNARNCDGDILVVHAREAEEAFVAEGSGSRRSDLMYNDFVIVGPADDPAGIAGSRVASQALAEVAESESVFASRGDDSGTDKKEKALWREAGVDPEPSSGAWYRETGSGMGTTLNIAVGMDAYALTDRATWTRHANRGDHTILVEGDPALHNQYGVIPISAERCPNIDAEGAALLETWLLSPDGQAAIASFEMNGEPLFTPNASTNGN